MSQSENPLSKVGPWDLVAQGYAEVTMKLFQYYADQALAMVDLNGDSHVLDVACGPGTLALTAAPRVKSVQGVDFSPSMLQILQDTIDAQQIQNIKLSCEDCQSLPFEDDRFDAAFSMFGLMFFPDRLKGHREIHRTLKPGGTTLISSWASVAESTIMQAMFGALKAINPSIPDSDDDIESLENPDYFKEELEMAGFEAVKVEKVNHEQTFETAERFWTDMVKGSAPIVMMKQRVSPAQWEVMSNTAVNFIKDNFGAENITFNAMANFGIGLKPG